ncbi:zinc-dependent metalloprotease [Butyricimonas synergistica]|uniref:zinc-dependent metalloprotease n=1 Tax=Butyricimonas synergistica TaxID=544644 RepID=UPI0003705C03|nr:zinc-dependent metalloprotease [Butyricimonas synergistica]
MRKWIIPNMVFILLLSGFCTLAGERKAKKNKQEEKRPGKYEQLFKGKTCTTVSSDFMTLHKVDEKLYFEMPLRLFGREMLLSSSVSKTSNNMAAVVGYTPNVMHIRFVLQDSTVQLRSVASTVTADLENERMKQVLGQGYGDPVLFGYKVLAYTPDSTAVVFDGTGLFHTDIAQLSPLAKTTGRYEVQGHMKPAQSRLGEVKAFEDNVSIRSTLLYTVNVWYSIIPVLRQVAVTLEANRTLMLLPEERMRPRLSDSRVGTFLTNKRYIPEEGSDIRPYSYIHRWRIEPKDAEAYQRGVLTEPVKPIVMYVDTDFPESWKEPIKKGILRWNKAFEKIGFRDVIQVRDFPTDDPDFDPDNLKYSCVRYVPYTHENAEGLTSVDPVTGEILNAGIFIYNNVTWALNNWRFLQTAQIDPSVRTKKMPDDIMGESLEYVVAHEMGHCLGLMHNMAASSAFPVDSLRSAFFTRKYGTTPSIMDYARFNYVAQPGDQGVKLTPPDLGVYDEYVIKWMYTPFPDAASVREEAKILEAWVDEKAGDPMYRYGRQQDKFRYDPSALEEDLGDDALKAGDYGIANLKYIVENINHWIQEDVSADHRKQLYTNLTKQYERYLMNVLYNIGGIYLNEVKDGTPGERFTPVPREVQKASVDWLLRQLRDSEWLDNRDLVDRFGLGIPASWRVRTAVLNALFARGACVTLSSHLSDSPYTMDEFSGDVYRGIWASALEGRASTRTDRLMQRTYLNKSRMPVSYVGGNRLGLQSAASAYAVSFDEIWAYGLEPGGLPEQVMEQLWDMERTGTLETLTSETEHTGFGHGYGWQGEVNSKVLNNEDVYFYKMVRECRDMLEKQVRMAPEADRPHYRAMLLMTRKILMEKK